MSKITPPPAMTDEQIEAGRKKIFSTENPFCPCDSKTMRKAAQWVERARDKQWLDMLAQKEPKCPHGNWIDCAICDKPAAPVAQQAVPDGCKVVPVEPTLNMVAAGQHTLIKTKTATDVFRSMLAAAPDWVTPVTCPDCRQDDCAACASSSNWEEL